MAQDTHNPLSPASYSASKTAATSSLDEPVPLDSPLRTTPIHPSIPSIRVPADASTSNLNPITLQPFTGAELERYGFEKLRRELGGGERPGDESEALQKAKDDAVRQLKARMEERDAKSKEIEREMDEKEKIREVERKVYRKKMGGGGTKDG